MKSNVKVLGETCCSDTEEGGEFQVWQNAKVDGDVYV